MIAENCRNLKIHFAGGESLIRSNLILRGIESKYVLFTIFPYLADSFGIKHGYQRGKEGYKEIVANNLKYSKHSIQDSGIFSLVFGAAKANWSKEFIDSWYHKLVELTLEENFTGSVVEVDSQKLFGVENAWYYRERMRRDLPNNRIINVFHLEDGQKGLDRLIEFSDYIALSIPELRFSGKRSYVEKIAHYVKNKKPEIDIHLLGCTENKLMRNLSFCSSADSTSWTAFNKFGFFRYNNGNKTFTVKKGLLNKDVLREQYYDRAIELMEMSGLKKTEGMIFYNACHLLQLEYLMKQYTHYAGPQD